VERFRQPDAQDQAPAQYQALEPALEDRPSGRFPSGSEQAALAHARLVAQGPPDGPWAPCAARPLPTALGPNQERFFFGLLRECLEKGVVSEQMLREEMARNHVRHDALELVERTPPLAA
jgi:hypothetical protein